MRADERPRSAQVLLVEDNRGDAIMAKLAFRRAQMANELTVAETAEKGLSILRGEGEYTGAPRPDIILLDLNLPYMNGQEFLSLVKNDSDLRCIPVIILSSSSADSDVWSCYNRFANGYIAKPVGLEVYGDVVAKIEQYWFSLMQMPPAPAPTLN